MYVGKHRDPNSTDRVQIHGSNPMSVKLHLNASPSLGLVGEAGSLLVHLDPDQVVDILTEAQRTFEVPS